MLSCCGSTLSLVYISSSIVLNLLSYLGPIKKTQNTLCSASPKLCISVVSNFSVPREIEKMFKQKFGVIFKQAPATQARLRPRANVKVFMR